MQKKIKHNKKRNSVFLYEALMKEITGCILHKDEMRKAVIISLFKEHFHKNSLLRYELEIYQGVLETRGLQRDVAERILIESQKAYSKLDKTDIFNEQTKLVNSINRRLTPGVFSNFVANYKTMATIAQIFNETLPAKDKVILENILIERMCSKNAETEPAMKPLDDLVFKTYIKKFNEKYGNVLLKEQKELLTHYIMAFSDGGTALKFFLNEEIGRIRGLVVETAKKPEFKNDKQLLEMMKKLGGKIEDFKIKKFDQAMLADLLKIQNFVKEATLNG